MADILVLMADYKRLLPSVSLAIALLIYWNIGSLLYRMLLVFIWHSLTLQAYVVTVLAYDFIGSLCHFSLRRWVRGARETIVSVLLHLWPTSCCLFALTLYAGNVLDAWMASIATHASLAAWTAALHLWLRSSRGANTNSSTWERVQLLVCYTLAAAVIALKWSFLATTDPYADLTVPPSLKDVNAHVWYAMTVSTLGLLWEALLGFLTSALRIGLRGPVQLPFVTTLSRLMLGNTLVIDPHSDEFALACNKVYALLVLASAWIYSPAQLPVGFQLVIVARLYMAQGASRKLAAYQSVLETFPIVAPDAGAEARAVLAEAADMCAICREPLFPTDDAQWRLNPVRQLPCGHRLHGNCLRPWVVRHPACPLCRHPTSPLTPHGDGHAASGSLSGVLTLAVVRAAPLRRTTRAQRPTRSARSAATAASSPTSTPSPSASTVSSATRAAAPSIVLPPLAPLAPHDHPYGFGGGSLQPLVPRLRMRPPAPPAAQPHPSPPLVTRPSAARAAVEGPVLPPSTTPSTSVSSSETAQEIHRIEEALRIAQRKRQRLSALLDVQEQPAAAPSATLTAEGMDRLFSDDPSLMGHGEGLGQSSPTRFRRME